MRKLVVVFLSLAAVLAMVLQVNGQWIRYPTPGTPRTADGKPNLSAPSPKTRDGKPSLAGIWQRVPLKLPPRPFGTPNNLLDWMPPGSEIPMLPWAAALFKERSEKNLGGGRPS